jgi:hypothetical protein
MFADTDFPPVSGGSSFLQGFISKLQGGSVDGTQLPTTFEYGEFASQPKGSTGGSRGEFDRDYIEKMKQPGTPMPDWMRQNPPLPGPQTPGESGAQQAFGTQFPTPFGGNEFDVAASPSFDVNKPYIPGKQDYTGIPNATPEMLRRLQQRKMVNPGGQELPGFLKPV